MSFRNIILKAWFSQRERAIDRFRRRPVETQARMFRQLLRRGRFTEFGDRYDLRHIRSVERFQSQVETFDYETFKPYIERMMEGVRSVTAPGRVSLFARSSGTTSDRSKYIPVTMESLWWNHTLGMRDVATVFSANNPKTRVFEGKTLTLGGSCSREGRNLVGDLSALLIHETTFWSGWFRAPRTETAIIPDFDEKCAAICRQCVGEPITAFAGVPSWNLALMRRVLEYTGRKNLLEVWPGLEMFAHGGVEFAPYRTSFEELIPSEKMKYMETYNASEGFFAMADDPSRSDMLLMLDYGTFFEFRSGTQIVPLEGVECGKVYAVPDHLEQRPVALRDRRHGGIHLDESLPHPLRGPHAAVYQRFRRGADRRQRRTCAAGRLPEDGGRRERIQRRAVLHVAPRTGRARVDRGVRTRAGQPRTFRRGARRGVAGRQFGLRRQAPDHARAAAFDGRGARDVPRVDARAG